MEEKALSLLSKIRLNTCPGQIQSEFQDSS